MKYFKSAITIIASFFTGIFAVFFHKNVSFDPSEEQALEVHLEDGMSGNTPPSLGHAASTSLTDSLDQLRGKMGLERRKATAAMLQMAPGQISAAPRITLNPKNKKKLDDALLLINQLKMKGMGCLIVVNNENVSSKITLSQDTVGHFLTLERPLDDEMMEDIINFSALLMKNNAQAVKVAKKNIAQKYSEELLETPYINNPLNYKASNNYFSFNEIHAGPAGGQNTKGNTDTIITLLVGTGLLAVVVTSNYKAKKYKKLYANLIKKLELKHELSPYVKTFGQIINGESNDFSISGQGASNETVSLNLELDGILSKIADNNIHSAFDEINNKIASLKDQRLTNEFIFLKSSFNNIESRYNNQLINFKKYHRARSKVISELLHFLSDRLYVRKR